MICNILAASWLKGKFKLADFMPFAEQPEPQERKPQTVEQQQSVFDRVSKALATRKPK